MQGITPVTASDLKTNAQSSRFLFEVYNGTKWVDLTDIPNPVNTLPTDTDAVTTNFGSDGTHTWTISTDYSIHNTAGGTSVKWVYGSGSANFYYDISGTGWGSVGTEWSFSVYARRADGADFTPTGMYLYTLSDNRSITSYTKTSIGNGWYRFSCSYTFAVSAKLWLVGIFGLPSTTIYFDGWMTEPGLGTSEASISFLKGQSCEVAGAGKDTEPVAGSWSVSLDNSLGLFHPYHPTSTYKDLIKLGRKVRLSWGAVYSGVRYFWQRIIGYMDQPKYDSLSVSVSGTDYMKAIADTKLFSPYTNWGDDGTFSTDASPTGSGAEIYAEADACEIGASEADNVTNWAGGGSGGVVSSEGPAPDSLYYLYFERDIGGNILEYAHNANVGSVTAGATYQITFDAMKTGVHSPFLSIYQTVGSTATLLKTVYISSDTWWGEEQTFTVTATGNLQLRVGSQGKYSASGDSVQLDNISIKAVAGTSWNIYELPSTARGVYYVILNGAPVWQGDEDGKGGWHYDSDLNALFFSEDLVIDAGTNNLVIYYYEPTAPENIVADILVASGLYASRALALSDMVYTPTGITIDKPWFEPGTSALEAIKLLCERCNYRFWFTWQGYPAFTPAPIYTTPASFDFDEVKYASSISLSQDIGEVRNHITIEGCERSVLNVSTQAVDQSTWRGSAEDSTSITAYQRKTYALNNHLFQSQASADDMCLSLLSFYRNPKFYLELKTSHLPVPLEVGDTISIKLPVSLTDTVTKYGIIRGISLQDGEATYRTEVYVPFDTTLVVQNAAIGVSAPLVELDYPGVLVVQNAAIVLSSESPDVQQLYEWITYQDGTEVDWPTGATQAIIECWGGGGIGGNGEMVGRAGGGGGGGYSKITVDKDDWPSSLFIYIPNSGIGDGTYVDSGGTICYAAGGDTGDLTGGGQGGQSSGGIGDTRYSGGNGYFYGTGYTGGGGGSSAGTASNGNNATSSAGATAVTGGGNGGNGGARYNDGSDPTTPPGGGGGGAGADLSTERYGGSGSIGKIKITFS